MAVDSIANLLGEHLRSMSLAQMRMRSPNNNVSRDRLSELPDEVIVQILSCLPVVDAVRTVLLRCFGDLWTLVHTLRFDVQEFLDSMYRYKNHKSDGIDQDNWYNSDDYEQFTNFVRNVLMVHKRLSIHKFHLCLDSLPFENIVKAADDIKLWLRVALDKQAKELEFSDTSDPQYGTSNYTILPKFESRSLVTLTLTQCDIEPQLQVNLGSLKKLLLIQCRMSDETFQRFVSGCPSLRELTIGNPSKLKKLSFNAPNINKLFLIVTDEDDTSENPLLLDCPNLKTLYLAILNRLPELLDISSVRHVNIIFFHYGMDEDKDNRVEENKILESFFGKFDVIEVFKLSSYASEAFLRRIYHLKPLQNRWKRVILELQEFCQSCLSGIWHLMSTLENLEEIIIYTTKDFKVDGKLVPLKHPTSCVMPQLKTIILHGHVNSWDQQRIVESLLKSAPFLDKLVIVPIKH